MVIIALSDILLLYFWSFNEAFRNWTPDSSNVSRNIFSPASGHF